MQFSQILPIWLDTLRWLVGLGIMFAVLEYPVSAPIGMGHSKFRRTATPVVLYAVRVLLLVGGFALALGEHNVGVTIAFFDAYGEMLHLPSWQQWTLVGLGILGIAALALKHAVPCTKGMYWWKDDRAVMTDLVYWFVVPLFLRIVQVMLLFAGVGLVLGIHDKQELAHFFMYGYGPLSQLPLAVQCILLLLGEDLYMYWVHRLFHTNAIWPFHAVHHSTTTLDWSATRRFHPVNNVLQFGLADIISLLCGFSPLTIAALGPFNIAFSALVHANLNWTFGPFKYLLASPVFHRWHHTYVKEGGMKNFAPTFPFLDLMFGTFYMPKDRLPQVFGVNQPDFPKDFWGQFIYPFRKIR